MSIPHLDKDAGLPARPVNRARRRPEPAQDHQARISARRMPEQGRVRPPGLDVDHRGGGPPPDPGRAPQRPATIVWRGPTTSCLVGLGVLLRVRLSANHRQVSRQVGSNRASPSRAALSPADPAAATSGVEGRQVSWGRPLGITPIGRSSTPGSHQGMAVLRAWRTAGAGNQPFGFRSRRPQRTARVIQGPAAIQRFGPPCKQLGQALPRCRSTPPVGGRLTEQGPRSAARSEIVPMPPIEPRSPCNRQSG